MGIGKPPTSITGRVPSGRERFLASQAALQKNISLL